MSSHSRSNVAAHLAATMLLCIGFLGNPGGQGLPKTAADVPRITTRDFSRMHEAGAVLAVDVRSAEVFRLGRIAGAINVPLDQIAGRASELRERAGGKTIVTYCSCTAEQSSAEAGLRLIAAGVTNVRALVGGYPEWVLAGGRIDRS